MTTSTSGSRVLVVNQYFRPDVASTGQIAADICDGLAESGFNVDVVSAEPCYTSDSPTAAPRETSESGVRVHRVSMGLFKGKENILKRYGGYLWFMARAWNLVDRIVADRKPDVVLTFHNPPFIGLLGARLRKKYGVPFVYSLYDILPEVVLKAGWNLPALFSYVWNRLNARIHEQADRIIVLSDSMAEALKEKGVPGGCIETVSLWARPELATGEADLELRREMGVADDDLFLLYAGNMGYMHDLKSLIDAAARLEGKRVRFVFIGRGPKREETVREVENRKLGNVIFLDYQPEDRFKRILTSADAAFVTLKPGMEKLCFPSRTLTFMSAGVPIVALMDASADVAQMVERASFGWHVRDAGELVALTKELRREDEILRKMGARAREVYTSEFGLAQTVQSYVEVTEQALTKKSITFDRGVKRKSTRLQ